MVWIGAHHDGPSVWNEITGMLLTLGHWWVLGRDVFSEKTEIQLPQENGRWCFCGCRCQAEAQQTFVGKTRTLSAPCNSVRCPRGAVSYWHALRGVGSPTAQHIPIPIPTGTSDRRSGKLVCRRCTGLSLHQYRQLGPPSWSFEKFEIHVDNGAA
jgi:hypothetical protein